MKARLRFGDTPFLLGTARPRGQMHARGDFRGVPDDQRYPVARLEPVELVAPCPECLARLAAGDPLLAKHPCCQARLASRGVH